MISPTPLPRMDRVVKSLVSSKSNKNQFLTDLRLQKKKGNPTLGKNILFKWQYSILSTSRWIEPFLLYTTYIIKIGWWRQKELAAQATSIGIANSWNCLFSRFPEGRTDSMPTAAATVNHHQPPSCQQLLHLIISEFGINFQGDNQHKILYPSRFKEIFSCWLCSYLDESGNVLYHANFQPPSKNLVIEAASMVICKVYSLLLKRHYLLMFKVYAWEKGGYHHVGRQSYLCLLTICLRYLHLQPSTISDTT